MEQQQQQQQLLLQQQQYQLAGVHPAIQQQPQQHLVVTANADYSIAQQQQLIVSVSGPGEQPISHQKLIQVQQQQLEQAQAQQRQQQLAKVAAKLILQQCKN